MVKPLLYEQLVLTNRSNRWCVCRISPKLNVVVCFGGVSVDLRFGQGVLP